MAVTVELTTAVLAMNVVEVAPEGTVTDVGTVTLEVSDDRFTTTPDAEAA